ncbi:protein DGS1, mitochondrial [Daucus carota subsp. sativus]|uniref:protein DGS1, mitochondrial n=1 Tax=Daucus carota subsp. sativus TaxID=79200 RepID=UPI0007EFCAE8|nr:PREDICTED: protein DGS1, mitochondrial [Daucus carota subsp. sativus]
MERSSSPGKERAMAVWNPRSLWNNMLEKLTISDEQNDNNKFKEKISNLYKLAASTTGRRRRRRRKTYLPLPLPSVYTTDYRLKFFEGSGIFDVLEDILEYIFVNMHSIQKNLQFWQSKAEGSRGQKVYFMICERGPRAFVDGIIQLIRDCVSEGSGMQNLYYSATSHIYDRIDILTSLRFALATFLAQIYIEIDKFGDELAKDAEKSGPLLLLTVDGLFSKLEASIAHLYAPPQNGSSVDGSCSVPLRFEKLSEVMQEGSQWTGSEIKDAVELIYQNLHKLDSYLSVLVSEHQKPRKVTLYWMRYACGILGISVCSAWLLRHSKLTGSHDIEHWIREAKDSTVSFFSDHVEKPLLSIRDELFDTFRKRHKGVMELEEVKLTTNSLHRMLLAFSEQTQGQKFPDNASDQELLEIMMARYEKELMHPIQNLLKGELVRAILIQIQKLKLDIETALLELDQILRANEINFAVLAALPAFLLSLAILALIRAWLKQDTRAEGRGRIARLQRRLLIVEVEKRIMDFQTCIDKGQDEDAQCTYGLLLYSLDRLYRAVESHAKATGEWQCLRQDITDLGRPGLQTAYKLAITSRMDRVYDCLLPSLKRY